MTSGNARAGYDKKSMSTGLRSTTDLGESVKRCSKAFGNASSKNGAFSGPSHVLFSSFASGCSPVEFSSEPEAGASPSKTREKQYLRFDPRLERDYIHKRKRAHQIVACLSISSSATNIVSAPWEGVSNVERELIDCCESLDSDFYSRDNYLGIKGDDDETDSGVPLLDASLSSPALPSSPSKNLIGGVLAVEKETIFAAILSRGCHTLASRSLVLAILERTMEVYLADEATGALLLQQQKGKDNKEDYVERDNTGVGSVRENNHNENERAAQPRQQSLRYQNRVKRVRSLRDEELRNVSDHVTSNTNICDLDILSSSAATDITTCAKQGERRFEFFFAAGGLRILNQWLTTASLTTASDSAVKSISSTRGRTETTHAIQKAHATRPIALSILRFLEHIPFDKKTVTKSKINKQIHKLGKKVALIKEANQKGQAPEEDLDDWTSGKPLAHDEPLVEIIVAVDAVKASWREKAKTKRERKQPDPFSALQSKMKERLEVLTAFESGTLLTKPGWYRSTVAPATLMKKAAPSKRKAPSEAEVEKLNLQKKIKQVQSRSQKSLQQLREKLRRRKIENSHIHSTGAVNSVSSFSNNRKVTWKDGLKSQVARNRKMLEEVFVFAKDLPSSANG